MNLVGMMRCRNGARWIAESVWSLLEVCSKVFVLDDHSTDSTCNILAGIPGSVVIPTPYETVNEARDKSYLVAQIRQRANADWIVCIDADEVLMEPELVRVNAESGRSVCHSFHVLFLWDRPDQIRVDGVYGDFWRASMFRNIGNGRWFERDPNGPNLHCNSVPTDLNIHVEKSNPPIRLKHYGPMLREDRIRKYHEYLRVDPHPESEDYYRHSVQGDLPQFPATAKYRWGGPLQLVPLEQAENRL